MAGNYDKDYQIVQTTGRKINNPGFVDEDGFSLSASADTQIDSFIDGLISYAKPTRSVQEHVIVNRFAAPGGPEQAGDAQGGPGLDYEAAELSPYNALPYRNLVVRQYGTNNLRTFYAEHSDAFGISGSVDSDGYDTSANYHKTNRNTVCRYEFEDATASYENLGGVTKSFLYDNGFVSHAIPQTEEGYYWIRQLYVDGPCAYATSSVDVQLETGSVLLLSASLDLNDEDGGPFTSLFSIEGVSDLNLFVYEDIDITGSTFLGTNLANSGDGAEYDYQFNGEDVTWGVLYNDLFSVIGPGVEVPRFLNGRGLFGVYNQKFIDESAYAGSTQQDWTNWLANSPGLSSEVFNKRGYRGGWNSWRQVRQTDNKVRQEQRRRNYYVISEKDRESLGYNIDGGRYAFNSAKKARLFTEPVTNMAYRPIKHYIDTTDTPAGSVVEMVYSFDTRNEFFANDDLNEITQRPDRVDTKFEGVVEQYQNDAAVNDFSALRYSKRIWPRPLYEGLSETRGRDLYLFPWNSDPELRYGVRYNYRGKDDGELISGDEWPISVASPVAGGIQVSVTASTLDTSNPATAASGTGRWGELINKHTTYHNGTPASIENPSPMFARPVIGYYDQDGTSGLVDAYKISGYTYTPREPLDAGAVTFPDRPPMIDDYSEWRERYKGVAQMGGVLPEFRISDRMPYYYGEGNQPAGDPLTDSAFMTVTGSAFDRSDTSSFFARKVDSADLSDFEYILDVNNDNSPSKVRKATLRVKALKTFLPYEGFYPIQRAKEIAGIFRNGITSLDYSLTGGDNNIRTLMAPLFGPGLLFNSMKAQYAVDYPVMTGSFAISTLENEAEQWIGTRDVRFGGNPVAINEDFHVRLPFETLASPLSYLGGGIDLVDMECHPSAAIDSTASWSGKTDRKYLLAINNFLSETAGFFLGRDSFTRIASKPAREVVVDSDIEEYRMDFIVTNDVGGSEYLTNPFWEFEDGASLKRYNQAEIYDNIPFIDSYAGFRRGEIYGPPSRHIFVNTVNSDATGTAGYSPFTPPSFWTMAYARMTFRPTKSVYTIGEIIAETTTSCLRPGMGSAYDTTNATAGDGGALYEPSISGTSARNAMQVTASFEIFGLSEVPLAEFDPNGAPTAFREPDGSESNQVWTIGPRWEVPVARNTAVSPAIAAPLTNDSSSLMAGGSNTGRGRDPEAFGDAYGVWMRVRAPGPSLLPSSSVGNSVTGSLVDLLGFSTDPVRVGRPEETSRVHEGVVMIPYIVDDRGSRFVEPIDGDKVFDEEWVRLVQTAFVFPPALDNRFGADPYLFYFVDFSHDFSRVDLVNMWDGQAPALIDKPEYLEKEVDVRPDLFEQDGLRWMMFKVKQRGKTNYFKTVDESGKDKRYIAEYELGILKEGEERYSYNWPYDFFTMIERAEVEVDITLARDKGGE